MASQPTLLGQGSQLSEVKVECSGEESDVGSNGGGSVAQSPDQGVSASSWAADDGRYERFFKAVEAGDLGQIRSCVEQGARLDTKAKVSFNDNLSRNHREMSPLHLAARKGQKEVAALLLELGAPVDAQDSCEWTPLHWAAYEGFQEVAALLLERGAQIDAQSAYKPTPLHFAARQGHREVAALLLERGAQIDAQAAFEGPTPLHFAARQGHREVAALLLEHKAPTEAKDTMCSTPLHVAAEIGHPEVAALLLEHKAPTEARRGLNETPLHCAVRTGHPEVAGLLLRGRADCNAQMCDETPFGLAIDDNHLGVVKAMLENGAGMQSDKDLAKLISADGPEAVECWESLAVPIKQEPMDWTKEPGLWMEHQWIKWMHDKNARFQGLAKMTRNVAVFVAGDRHGHEDQLYWNIRFPGIPGEQLWLRDAHVVRAKCAFVPGAPLSALTSLPVAQALARTSNADLMATSLADAIVTEAWRSVRTWHMADMVVSAAMVAGACDAAVSLRSGDMVHETATLILALGAGKRIVEEFWQFLKACKNCEALIYYCLSSETWLDWAFAACNLAGFVVLHEPVGGSMHKLFLAVWFAMMWLRLLYSCRVLDGIGPRFLPVFRAIKDSLYFGLVVIFCILASTHAYYVMGRREDPTPAYAAFMQSFRLGVLGDFDLFEFEGLDASLVPMGNGTLAPEDPDPSVDYVATHLLFYAISVGVTVLLMNLFIAVLSSNYDLHEDMAKVLFLQARAATISNLQDRPWNRLLAPVSRAFRHCWEYCMGPDYYDPSERRLFFYEREQPPAEELRSLRSVMHSSLERLEGKFEERFKAVKQDLSTAREEVADLKEDVKQDVSTAREEVANLKEEMTGLKEEVAGLRKDILAELRRILPTDGSAPRASLAEQVGEVEWA